MTKTICTSLSLQSAFLYQLQPLSECEYTIVVVKSLGYRVVSSLMRHGMHPLLLFTRK